MMIAEILVRVEEINTPPEDPFQETRNREGSD